MQRLDDIFDFSFELLALLCSAKPHKLIWSLNEKLHVDFKREIDISLIYREEMERHFIYYVYQTDHATLHLIKNKSQEKTSDSISYLLPELSQYDYVLLIDDPSKAFQFDKIKALLRELSIVEHQLLVDASTLKNRDNLMFYYG